MCGRFTQHSDLAILETRFGASARGIVAAPRYNLAPSQEALVVIQPQDRRLALLRWGLVPSWAKNPAIGNRLINARAETAAGKPSFRNPFRRRRCLVPSDGFYEWRAAGKGQPKVPLIFVRKDRAPFAMAGLWEIWRGPEDQKLATFTILTTKANAVVQPIHDRMPVILSPEAEGPWLDPSQHNHQALAGLLAPLPAELMEAFEVAPTVNSPAHEGPDLIAPIR